MTHPGHLDDDDLMAALDMVDAAVDQHVQSKRTQTQTAFTQPMPLPGNNGHAGPSVARTNVPAAASHAVPGNQMHPALQRAAAPSKSGSRAPGQGFTGRGPSAGRGSGGAVAAVAVTAGAVVAGPVAAGAPRGGAWSQRPTPPQGSNAVLTQSHPMPGDAGEAGRHGAKRPREGQGGAWGAGGGGYQPRPGAAPHAPAGAVSRAAEAALAGQAAGQAQGGPLHRQMESMQQEIQRMGRAVAEREANISLLRDRVATAEGQVHKLKQQMSAAAVEASQRTESSQRGVPQNVLREVETVKQQLTLLQAELAEVRCQAQERGDRVLRLMETKKGLEAQVAQEQIRVTELQWELDQLRQQQAARPVGTPAPATTPAPAATPPPETPAHDVTPTTATVRRRQAPDADVSPLPQAILPTQLVSHLAVRSVGPLRPPESARDVWASVEWDAKDAVGWLLGGSWAESLAQTKARGGRTGFSMAALRGLPTTLALRGVCDQLRASLWALESGGSPVRVAADLHCVMHGCRVLLTPGMLTSGAGAGAGVAEPGAPAAAASEAPGGDPRASRARGLRSETSTGTASGTGVAGGGATRGGVAGGTNGAGGGGVDARGQGRVSGGAATDGAAAFREEVAPWWGRGALVASAVAGALAACGGRCSPGTETGELACLLAWACMSVLSALARAHRGCEAYVVRNCQNALGEPTMAHAPRREHPRVQMTIGGRQIPVMISNTPDMQAQASTSREPGSVGGLVRDACALLLGPGGVQSYLAEAAAMFLAQSAELLETAGRGRGAGAGAGGAENGEGQVEGTGVGLWAVFGEPIQSGCLAASLGASVTHGCRLLEACVRDPDVLSVLEVASKDLAEASTDADLAYPWIEGVAGAMSARLARPEVARELAAVDALAARTLAGLSSEQSEAGPGGGPDWSSLAHWAPPPIRPPPRLTLANWMAEVRCLLATVAALLSRSAFRLLRASMAAGLVPGAPGEGGLASRLVLLALHLARPLGEDPAPSLVLTCGTGVLLAPAIGDDGQPAPRPGVVALAALARCALLEEVLVVTRTLCATPEVAPAALDDLAGAEQSMVGQPLRNTMLMAGMVEDWARMLAARAAAADGGAAGTALLDRVWESVLRHVPDAPCTLSGFLETASMPPEFPKLRRADATPPDVLVAMGSRWPHSLPVSLAPWAARALHRQLWAGPSLSLCNVSDLESLVRSIRRRLLERLAEPQPGEGSG